MLYKNVPKGTKTMLTKENYAEAYRGNLNTFSRDTEAAVNYR